MHMGSDFEHWMWEDPWHCIWEGLNHFVHCFNFLAAMWIGWRVRQFPHRWFPGGFLSCILTAYGVAQATPPIETGGLFQPGPKWLWSHFSMMFLYWSFAGPLPGLLYQTYAIMTASRSDANIGKADLHSLFKYMPNPTSFCCRLWAT